MMRTMFLDNILWNSARLHKHNWILLSGNERYKECEYRAFSHSTLVENVGGVTDAD
jgi:hypothetical protein